MISPQIGDRDRYRDLDRDCDIDIEMDLSAKVGIDTRKYVDEDIDTHTDR